MIHSEITAVEEADRLSIRELVDAYAHCADRRDSKAQKSLFTDDEEPCFTRVRSRCWISVGR